MKHVKICHGLIKTSHITKDRKKLFNTLSQFESAFNVSFSTVQETILKNIYSVRMKEIVNSPIVKENHRAFVLWALYLAHHHKNYKEIENM